jgi:hypothetical protein
MPLIAIAGKIPLKERIVASRLSISQTKSYKQEVIGIGKICRYQVPYQLLGSTT